MMAFPEEVKKRLLFLDQIIKETKERIKKAPAGSLRISKSNSKIGYYHRLPGETKNNGSYISKKNISFAKSLAQNAYDTCILQKALAEKKWLIGLSREWETGLIESVFEEYSSFRRELIQPIWKPDAMFVNEWMNVDYVGKTIPEDDTCFYTRKGERVRSKSEVMIADMLKKNQIPYRYECPLTLNGVTIYPDFTTLNIRMRKTVYWEHFGLMDDHDYRENAFRKIKSYSLSGFFPGDQFIYTFETSKQPLDSRIIDATIKQYLL